MMMSEQRLIDANYLLNRLRGNVLIDVTPEIEHEIENAPTIDPVRHGKWIKPTKRNGISFNIPHCSVCEGVPCGVDENTNYCPNCGAKMDGE